MKKIAVALYVLAVITLLIPLGYRVAVSNYVKVEIAVTGVTLEIHN